MCSTQVKMQGGADRHKCHNPHIHLALPSSWFISVACTGFCFKRNHSNVSSRIRRLTSGWDARACFNCGAKVSGEFYCYGCQKHVCRRCETGYHLGGVHTPQEHLGQKGS